MTFQDDFSSEVAINLQHLVSIEKGRDSYLFTYCTGKEVKMQKNENSDALYKWLQEKTIRDMQPPTDLNQIQSQLESRLSMVSAMMQKMQK